MEQTLPLTYLYKKIQTDKPFYLFESMTPRMLELIHRIHEWQNDADNPLQELQMQESSIALLSLFLEQMEQRTFPKQEASLNSQDVERIFQTRRLLLEALPQIPPLAELASKTAMSISKLQKCFQQIFGKSIAQYALTEKMNLARKLLDTKKYTVSEVGYRLGYASLSHFTQAFKKAFGQNPKEYRQDHLSH
ncbi:MAG: helix-turn-helix transcriptional regulator [Fibrobacteraceae bacterium]|nr:helix-turn-helix transcriptional regulator [Fibrobacteraceae bacterium]